MAAGGCRPRRRPPYGLGRRVRPRGVRRGSGLAGSRLLQGTHGGLPGECYLTVACKEGQQHVKSYQVKRYSAWPVINEVIAQVGGWWLQVRLEGTVSMGLRSWLSSKECRHLGAWQ